MLELPAWELDQWRAHWREESKRERVPHPDRLELLLASLCAMVAGIGGTARRVEDFMPWRKDVPDVEPESDEERAAAGCWKASRDAMMALALATQGAKPPG